MSAKDDLVLLLPCFCTGQGTSTTAASSAASSLMLMPVIATPVGCCDVNADVFAFILMLRVAREQYHWLAP
jgi:drug/metabolite transporter (DMT)-like permease